MKRCLPQIGLILLLILVLGAPSAQAKSFFETDIQGKVIEEDNVLYFLGEKYDKKFQLPDDVDPDLKNYLNEPIHVIAGGFDMEQSKMWILRFFVPRTHEKIQVFPGHPGTSADKDVQDITDNLKKYGHLYVSKLELDITNMYLFNFAKSLKIELDPEEEKDLYPGTPGAKALVEMQEELLDSNAHTELDAPVEDDFSHIIDSVPGAQGAAIENRILDFAAALFVNTSGSSVEEKEITILSMEKVKIRKSPTGPITTVLLIKVSFQDESAYIKAELDGDESNITDIESLEASSNLVGAVEARNVLASKLDIENKEDITIIETLSTVNHVRDKPKGSSLSQTRIKTQEVALQVNDEVYVIQTTYIEIVKASSDEKTPAFDRSPETLTSAPYTRIAKEQSQSIITTSISKQQAQSVVATREKAKKIQKVSPGISPSPPTPVQQDNGVWALFRLVLPNHPVKRLSLLHQIEDNIPPAQTPADSSDDKNEGISKVEELEKRIDALALDERSRALKDKERMKQSSLKEKDALKSKGINQETQKKTKEKQMGKKGSR